MLASSGNGRQPVESSQLSGTAIAWEQRTAFSTRAKGEQTKKPLEANSHYKKRNLPDTANHDSALFRNLSHKR